MVVVPAPDAKYMPRVCDAAVAPVARLAAARAIADPMYAASTAGAVLAEILSAPLHPATAASGRASRAALQPVLRQLQDLRTAGVVSALKSFVQTSATEMARCGEPWIVHGDAAAAAAASGVAARTRAAHDARCHMVQVAMMTLLQLAKLLRAVPRQPPGDCADRQLVRA